MFIMIIGVTIIFLTVLIALALLIAAFPVLFTNIDNKILDSLFIRKNMGNGVYRDFGYAIIKYGEEELMVMKNYVIYAVNGVLIALLIVASILAICQLVKAKNKYFSIKLFATNFFIITISIVLLSLAVVVTGQWWLIVVMSMLAIGLGLLQIIYFVTIKDNEDKKNSAKLSEVERKINISTKKINDIEDKVIESDARLDAVQKNIDELELDQILDSSFTTEVKEIHKNLKDDHVLVPEQPIFDFQEIKEDDESHSNSNILDDLDNNENTKELSQTLDFTTKAKVIDNDTEDIKDNNIQQINDEKNDTEDIISQEVDIEQNDDEEIYDEQIDDEENNNFEQIENFDEYDEINAQKVLNDDSVSLNSNILDDNSENTEQLSHQESMNADITKNVADTEPMQFLDDIKPSEHFSDNIKPSGINENVADTEPMHFSDDIKPSEIKDISDLNKYNQNNQIENDLSTWLTDNIDDNISMNDDFTSTTNEYEPGSTTSLIQEINEHRRLKQKNLDKHNSWEEILNQDEIVGGETTMNNVKNPFDNINADLNQNKDVVINPEQVYYHSPISGKTIEIDSNRTQEVLFSDELYNEEEIYNNSSSAQNNYSEDNFLNSVTSSKQNPQMQQTPFKEQIKYSEPQYSDATVTEQLNSQNVNQSLYENHNKNTRGYNWSANDPNLSYQTDLYGAVSGRIDDDPLINLTDELLSAGVNYFNEEPQYQSQVPATERHRHINVDQNLANQTHIFVSSCPICQSNRLK